MVVIYGQDEIDTAIISGDGSVHDSDDVAPVEGGVIQDADDAVKLSPGRPS